MPKSFNTSPEVIADICRRYEAGEPLRTICKSYGLALSTVRNYATRDPSARDRRYAALVASGDLIRARPRGQSGQGTDEAFTTRWAPKPLPKVEVTEAIREDAEMLSSQGHGVTSIAALMRVPYATVTEALARG